MILTENNAKFLLKLNFAITFNTTKILRLYFNANITENKYSCKLISYKPKILELQLRSY